MSVDLIMSVIGAADKQQASSAHKKLVALDRGESSLFTRIVNAVKKKPQAEPAGDPGVDLIAQVMKAAPREKAEMAMAKLEGMGSETAVADADSGKDAGTKLEAALLTTLVQEMMPKDNGGLYGSGTAGEVWRDMHVQQIAEAAAKDGVLSLGDMTSLAPREERSASAVIRTPQWPYFVQRDVTPYAS